MTGAVPARRRWEERALAVLAYPANLAFAGLAGFLLSLGVVTWLSAWVAVGRALRSWSVDEDDRVFTNTFRAFAGTWRRTLPWSVAATVIAVVLGVNLLFLGRQHSPVALVLAMASIPVVVAFGLAVLTAPAMSARLPEATMRQWLVTGIAVAGRRPFASLVLVAIVGAFGATCVLLPTIAPFLGVSVPVWLGLVTVERTIAKETARETPT